MDGDMNEKWWRPTQKGGKGNKRALPILHRAALEPAAQDFSAQCTDTP